MLDRLLVVLNPLVREGGVRMWVDRRIGVARGWNDEIQAELMRPGSAVPMVCDDFFASDFIMSVELPKLVAWPSRASAPRTLHPISSVSSAHS